MCCRLLRHLQHITLHKINVCLHTCAYFTCCCCRNYTLQQSAVNKNAVLSSILLNDLLKIEAGKRSVHTVRKIREVSRLLFYK
jgi:hypothetical protein